MKFLTLLLVCCIAKNVASINIGQLTDSINKRMDALVIDKQKQVNALPGGANIKVPNAPKAPIPFNPDQVIVNPPKIPLPNPKCDLKGLTALLKAMFGRVKGSCSNVKKSKGPLGHQCEASKANFTAESNVMFAVTEQVSYEFPSFSGVVDPAIKGFVSGAGKTFDSLITACTAQDTKKGGKDIDVAVKNLAILLKMLFESTNSVTGFAKPAPGTNPADAVSTSEVLLSTMLVNVKTLLDLVTSVSSESSVSISGITKTLSAAVDALSTKASSGSFKLLGSACTEFSSSLTVIIKSESSIDKDAITKQCETIDTDLGKITDSVSNIEATDGDDEETPPTKTPGDTPPTEKPGDTPPTEKPEDTTPTVKPGDTPPTEKPGDTSPTVKPVDTPPTEKPGDTPPTEKPVDTSSTGKPGDTPLTDKPGDTPPTDKPGETTPTKAPKDTPETKPTASETLIKISLNIKVGIESIKKSCAPLKTDVPAMGGGLDASLTSVSTSLSALLSIVQSSGTTSVIQLSTLVDAAIAAIIKSLADFLNILTSIIDSLANDTSVEATTAVFVLKIIRKTIVSIIFKVLTSIPVFFKKLNLFVTVTLDSIVAGIAKIDLKSCDFKTTATDLTAIASPKEVNSESCSKVVAGLGKSATDAVSKIKTDDSGKFESRISFIFNGFAYTLRNTKTPKVVDGIISLQTSFSDLIKKFMKALSCAEASKGNDDSSKQNPTEACSAQGAGSASSKKPKCEPIAPDSLKLVFTGLLGILDASKSITADKTFDSKLLVVFKNILKTFLTAATEVLTGLSKKLSEQTIDVSALLSLGKDVLTKATSDANIDFETLNTKVDGVLCYSPIVDATTSTLDGIKEIQAKITASNPEGDNEAKLSELFTTASVGTNDFSKQISSLAKYYTKPVDRVTKAVKTINSMMTTVGSSIDKLVLNDFLLKISLGIVELTDAYAECAANTKLDVKDYNGLSGLKIIVKSCTSIINSVLISLKAYLKEIPSDCIDFFTSLSDACSADVSSPDTDPSEVGGKIKGICDKQKEASKASDGGGDGAKTGGSTATGEDKTTEPKP